MKAQTLITKRKNNTAKILEKILKNRIFQVINRADGMRCFMSDAET